MAKGKRKKGTPLLQRLLLAGAGMMLALCVASVTYGFFLRHSGSGAGTQAFRIEVLNGTDQIGLAKKAARSLTKRGIDVLKVGNADDSEYEESILIGRRENSQVVVLGKLLNCDNIIVQLREKAIVDATLILGMDYKKLKLGFNRDFDLP
jgi:hypothetical protein